MAGGGGGGGEKGVRWNATTMKTTFILKVDQHAGRPRASVEGVKNFFFFLSRTLNGMTPPYPPPPFPPCLPLAPTPTPPPWPGTDWRRPRLRSGPETKRMQTAAYLVIQHWTGGKEASPRAGTPSWSPRLPPPPTPSPRPSPSLYPRPDPQTLSPSP